MSSANDWNKQVIEEFRANGGKVGGHFTEMNLLLLHTTGAKSGQPRINPLAYIKDGGRLVIAASKAGAATNPDWYYNVVATSAVEVEVGSERFAAEATVATEPERTRLYGAMADQYPGFAEYERKTSRVIPIVVLRQSGSRSLI